MKCKDCDNWKCLDRSYGEAECVHYKCDGQSSISQQSSLQSFNWQSFRAEAAKDILCAMINRFGTSNINMDDVVRWTNRLISKLKEKEEK